MVTRIKQKRRRPRLTLQSFEDAGVAAVAAATDIARQAKRSMLIGVRLELQLLDRVGAWEKLSFATGSREHFFEKVDKGGK